MKSISKFFCVALLLASTTALTSKLHAQDFGDFGLPGLQDLIPQLQGSGGFMERGNFGSGHVQPAYIQPAHGHPQYVNPGYQQPQCNNPVPVVRPVAQKETGYNLYEPDNIRTARNRTDVARAFFKTHQYSDAERRLNEVVNLVPKDTNAWQFRSLTLFAQGKYEAAAADAYDAIKLGNTWTAQVLNTIYPAADRYHAQLNRLVETSQTNPSMSVHFLLGYHYLVLNDLQNGRAQLQAVLELQPEEPVATQLLAVIDARLNQAGNSDATNVGSR